ncbi:MAG: TIGR02996 domain-containing protein [Labilithrix sp.]|nr:TIGR02996 domain-containing protein [Labilithrix sp.]MCW5809412.1 TIGR02996 domain-containing protein [Labilithrix sp.]
MDGRELLDAIVAHPDDDDARLVYADWLEAQGDTRGELIQLQVQLARLAADDPKRADLEARVELIDALHAKDWLADLWALSLPQTKFGFRRGFVETIATSMSVATTRADDLLARAPLLSVLELFVEGQRERMALADPASTRLLARATELTIYGRRAGNTWMRRGPIARLDRLAATPFTRLRSLRLASLRVRPGALGRFLASPHLATLEVLALDLALESAGALAGVFASPACPRLRVLDLAGTWLHDDALAWLAGWSFLDQLEVLDLSRGNVSADRARPIALRHRHLRVMT